MSSSLWEFNITQRYSFWNTAKAHASKLTIATNVNARPYRLQVLRSKALGRGCVVGLSKTSWRLILIFGLWGNTMGESRCALVCPYTHASCESKDRSSRPPFAPALGHAAFALQGASVFIYASVTRNADNCKVTCCRNEPKIGNAWS